MAHPAKPNILVFMLDTQRAQNMSCYGYEKPTTPNIDRLAEEGVAFLDNISPAVWTLPAVASLMTGLHVHSHGAGAHNESYGGPFVTLAEALTKAGYQTVAFYGNIYAAMSNHGFHESHLMKGHEKHIGPDCFDVSRRRMAEAMNWMDRHAGAGEPPFFLYVQVMDPHLPLHPVSPFKERFCLPDIKPEELEAIPRDVLEVYVGKHCVSERERAVLLSMYDAETAAADSHVGVLMDYLRAKRLIDETLIFIMSDHGEMFCERPNLAGGQHFTHHICCYEELIKTPLVARYPEAFPAGKRAAHSTQTHDIFPTVAEIVGFEAPHCQGFSLLSALGDQPRRAWTLTEYMKSIHIASRVLRLSPDIDQRLFVRWLKAYRKEGMKYIWASDMRDELYDLRADPREHNNLIERMPEKAKAMRLELEALMTALPPADRGDLVWGVDKDDPRLAKLRGMDWYLER